jgi:hypothetical protein
MRRGAVSAALFLPRKQDQERTCQAQDAAHQ